MLRLPLEAAVEPLGRRGDHVAPLQAELFDEGMCGARGVGDLAVEVGSEHAARGVLRVSA
jgi:hypothetical protein